MEFFNTIQGEGAFTGQAAFFIRLAGCDVGCTWCDVKESWDVESTQLKSIDFLVEEAGKYASSIVVITGGEPALYDLTELCSKLKGIGKRVHMETSGSTEIRGDFDWICLSPKKFKSPIESSWKRANELKVIVFNKNDLTWCDEQAEKVHSSCSLFLQVEWGKRNILSSSMVDKVKHDPRWKISVQTHKYLEIP